MGGPQQVTLPRPARRAAGGDHRNAGILRLHQTER